MMKRQGLIVLGLFFFRLMTGMDLLAQHTASMEQTLRIQVQLNEKNNKPLHFRSTYHPANQGAEKNNSAKKFTFVNGVVFGLMEAYCKDRIIGSNPDTLSKGYPYVAFYDRMDVLLAQIEGDTVVRGRGASSQTIPHPAYVTPIIDRTVFEPMLDLIVKRSFDPKKSVWKQEIQYIIIYHKDVFDQPIPVVAFRYADVKDKILAQMMLPNRHNESEIGSVKDYFEKHQYSGTITHTSQTTIHDYEQAARMKQRLIAREDEMWSH